MNDYLDSFDSPFQYDYFFIEDYNYEYESIE